MSPRDKAAAGEDTRAAAAAGGDTRATVAPHRSSPAARGYRFPAEWEPHDATWIAWPHQTSDWPGKFAAIPWVYAEIVRHLTRNEKVRILINSKPHKQRAASILERAGVDPSAVEFVAIRTDRGWTRDYGPIFLRRSLTRRTSLAVAGFRFNGWAKYRNCKLDARVAEAAANAFDYPFLPAEIDGKRFVLEGGAIDVNGSGTVVTTEECMLADSVQVRNPGLDRQQVEQALADWLAVTNVIWLGRGIAGDDTHGHVDDLCRFVNAKTLVLCRESDPGDANYQALEENWERVKERRLEDGSKPEVVALPMPAPLYFENRRLPASYANFYITNSSVLVPTFNDPNDRVALGVLAELFPDRTVVGIHAVDLVWGLGTLHCLTQQQPAAAHL